MTEHRVACEAWQEDLAGWLLAQLPPAREALLEQHLASCEICRSEADSLLGVSAVSLAADPDGMDTGAGEPPADLRERIVATISAERRTKRVVRAAVVALASVAAAIVAVVVLQGDGPPAPLRGEEVVFSVVPAGATADAVVAEDRAGGSMVQLTAAGLDPQVTYALWLSPPDGTWDDRVAAGTFRPDGDGEVHVRLRCALAAAEYGRAWATTPDGQIVLDTE